MKITDLRCAIIGKHPIVRITTDEGIHGLGEVEFTGFGDAGGPVSTTDLKDITEENTADGLIAYGTHSANGNRVNGKRITDETLLEKRGDGYYLKSHPKVRVDARSFKMSKSRGNVVNPDEIVKDYGADSFRLYEMYVGPLEAQKPWILFARSYS